MLWHMLPVLEPPDDLVKEAAQETLVNFSWAGQHWTPASVLIILLITSVLIILLITSVFIILMEGLTHTHTHSKMVFVAIVVGGSFVILHLRSVRPICNGASFTGLQPQTRGTHEYSSREEISFWGGG